MHAASPEPLAPIAPALHACPDCDLLQTVPPLAAGARARCARCGCLLATRPRHGHDVPLALALTTLVVFIVAHTAPLMSLSAAGRNASTTLPGGAVAMWQQGEPVIAALVLFCAFLAPAAFIGTMLAVLVAARRPRLPPWCADLLRLGAQMPRWAMFEVILLGILVALIKIAELATVQAGLGLYAMALLVLLLPALIVSVDLQPLWDRIDVPPRGADGPP